MLRLPLATVATLLILANGLFVPTGLAHEAATGAFALRAQIEWDGGDSACAPGTPATIDCHAHPGGPTAVPGLGSVRQEYLYGVVLEPPAPECRARGGFNVADYTGRLIVEGKGEILLAVRGIDECLTGPESSDTVVNNTQSFTITGGTGPYLGASGTGRVTHDAKRNSAGHAFGTDTWEGTLLVPGLDFDLTAPAIRGAVDKVARAGRGVKRVPVGYKVDAVDDVDGNVPVVCKPKPGSRFAVGRTRVRCTATDTSANTQTATFTVVVKARR